MRLLQRYDTSPVKNLYVTEQGIVGNGKNVYGASHRLNAALLSYKKSKLCEVRSKVFDTLYKLFEDSLAYYNRDRVKW